MASPITVTQLQDEILRRLGAPTIQVEVTADQVRDCIDRAIELYTDYHYEGSRKVYLTLQVSQQDLDNGGIFLIDRPIITITDVIYNNNDIGLGLGFASDFVGMFPRWIGYAHTNTQSSQGMFSQYNTWSLLTSELWTQHYKEFQQAFTNDVMWEWHRHTNELQIFNKLEKDQFIVMEAWVPNGVPFGELLDPSLSDGAWNPGHAEDPSEPQFNNVNEEQYILRDRWVKDYSTALVKQINGTVLKKFGGQKLPGGIEANGQQMYDEATNEIEALREELYSLERPLPIIMG